MAEGSYTQEGSYSRYLRKRNQMKTIICSSVLAALLAGVSWGQAPSPAPAPAPPGQPSSPGQPIPPPPSGGQPSQQPGKTTNGKKKTNGKTINDTKQPPGTNSTG